MSCEDCPNSLAVGSSNYIKVYDLEHADGSAIVSVTSATAAIYDDTNTLVAGSAISLTQVAGEPDAYEGNFPSTITLVDGDTYFVQAVIVADGMTRTKRKGVKATTE